MKKRRGFALLTVIFIMLALAVLAAGVVNLIFSGSRGVVDDYRYDKAFYIAEAGRAFGVKQVYNADWTQNLGLPATVSFGGGSFTVTASNQTANSITITSVGSFIEEGKTYQRSVSASLTKEAWGFLNDYAFYWGGGATGEAGTTVINNNVQIYGDIMINGNISSGSGVLISGDAYATGTITGGTVTGTIEESAALPYDPPRIDTAYYDNQISIANTYPLQDQTWDDTTVSGNIYINGNLIINNNKTVTVSGSAIVVVTGTVTVNNSVTFGNNLTLISGGLMTINNNAVIGDNCIFYSTAGFSINNNLESGSFSAGAGTSFITPGDFSSFWNNATIYGFIYCGGTLNLGNNTTFYGNIIANQVDYIGVNSQIYLDPSVVNYSLIQGLTGGTQTKLGTWQEAY